VDLDPELFAGLGPRELGRVREVAALVAQVEPGKWRPRFRGTEAGLGLLVLDGLLVRSVTLDEEVPTALIGAGDLIRPWESVEDEDAVVPCSVSWEVLEPTRLALLGRGLATAAADCPGLVAALLERTERRARSQGILKAIANMKRIDTRVLVLLWHVAERWGRVTASGVVVPLNLTHQRIATLVGAQRPTVTAALSRLSERGAVMRAAAGGYVLTDTARVELDALWGERAESAVA
jgi:CRP/FNR family transcriptional regulator, cyclic AMP receptor protein